MSNHGSSQAGSHTRLTWVSSVSSCQTLAVPYQREPRGQYISLKAKRGKEKTRKLHIWHTTRKQQEKTKELSMYRLREMDVDDKVCEQVSMTMLSEVYPKDVIERCVQQSEPWSTKARRVRARTALA